MIVEMKKAKLVVLKEDKEALLNSLQRCGELMMISTQEETEIFDTLKEDQLLQKTDKTLQVLKKYREKKPFITEEFLVEYDSFFEVDPKMQGLLDEIENCDQQIVNLKSTNQSLEEQLLIFKPWEALDDPLVMLHHTKYALIHYGYIDTKKVETFEDDIKALGADVTIVHQGLAKSAVMFAFYIDDEESVMDLAKIYGFTEISLPKLDQTVAEKLKELNDFVQDNEKNILLMEDKLLNLAKQASEIELMNDQITTQKAKKVAPLTKTIETVYVEGWVRVDRIDQLEQAIKNTTEVYDLELSDPSEEDTPPTYTQNNKLFSPFETVTDMFAKPNYKEQDPNPVMSFWYWLIFGMMLGDFGYGVVMFLAFFLLLKYKKPKGNAKKLFTVFMYSSVATMIWGVLFGSYFGITWNPIIVDPITQAMDLLLIALGIGTMHILTGIFMKALGNIRKGKVWDAIFDQFSWLFIFIGIGLFLFLEEKIVGQIIIGFGAVIVVLTAGRSKKNIFGKAASGVLGLYSITGYMSDILSYSRILALALSSAVIGFVMNLLAGMLQTSIIGFVFSLVIYVIGHGFNMAMGLLSAYVHDGRLQYIEFFGKFYEGGGYEFDPLAIELNYVDGFKK